MKWVLATHEPKLHHGARPLDPPTPEIQPWTAGCRFGSSIPQHGLGPSRGSPAAAPVPRFPSAETSFSYVSSCRPGGSLILRHRTQPRAAGCRSGFSIPSSGFGRGPPAAGPAPRSPAPDPAGNLHTIGEWWVATKALANGGVHLVGGVPAESWKKLQRNVLQLRSRTHVEAYVDRHRHQDRCQCHQEPDRDGSHYPQRQPSGEADRLVVTGPASCRTTPTPTWNVSRDTILVWWWRRAHRPAAPPPPMGVYPSICPRSQNSLDEALQ